jgi:hypothetical protein
MALSPIIIPIWARGAGAVAGAVATGGAEALSVLSAGAPREHPGKERIAIAIASEARACIGAPNGKRREEGTRKEGMKASGWRRIELFAVEFACGVSDQANRSLRFAIPGVV